MLYTAFNDYNWTVDNYVASWSESVQGTDVAANASANTKGTAVSLLSALAEDVYGISICFTRFNTAATAIGYLFDLLVDHAGGTSWSVKIANLIIVNPTLRRGGWWYYFPLYIPAGTSIGGQIQASTGSSTCRAMVRCYGKPSRPDAIMCGTEVQTLGANTATSRGTTITPGTQAYGSYTASLGTLNNDSFWWQAGLSSTDTTITASRGIFLDVAVNATNKVTTANRILVNADSNEFWGKSHSGSILPIRKVSAGQDVYCRASAAAGVDSGFSCAAYAVS